MVEVFVLVVEKAAKLDVGVEMALKAYRNDIHLLVADKHFVLEQLQHKMLQLYSIKLPKPVTKIKFEYILENKITGAF